MEDEYFEWLCGVVHGDDPEEPFYNLLASMHNCIFRWSIDMDENRAVDGRELRRKWDDQCFAPMDDIQFDIFMREPVSCLEVLVGLSIRIQDEIMWNPDKGDRVPVWFWLMVDNLGLKDLDDDHFYGEVSVDRVIETLSIWMDREYTRDGIGSIFPIPKCNKDLRRMQIWSQMSEYFLEFYGIEEDLDGIW